MEDAIAARIEFLNSERLRLLDSLREVDEELVIQNAMLGRHKNDKLPISNLPYHILSDIFLFLQRQELALKKVSAVHRSGIEFIASQVSYLWRDTVLYTPLLWRTIRMKVKPFRQEVCLEHLNARLDRSRDCLLDVVIEFLLPNPSQETRFYLALASHSSRWRKLSLISEYDGSLQLDPTAITTVTDAVHLELFSLSVRASHLQPRPVQRQALNFGSNTLTTVRLGGRIHGNIQLPFSHVTILQLVGCPVTLLHAAPSTLQHLSLTDITSVGQLTTPISLNNLLSLRIISNFNANVINWLITPRLRSLTLEQLPDFDWIIESPIPSVKYLVLTNCSAAASVLTTILTSLPCVHTLTINGGGQMHRFLTGLTNTDANGSAVHYRMISKLALFNLDRRVVEVLPTVIFVRCPSRERREAADALIGNSYHCQRLLHLTVDNRTRSFFRDDPALQGWLQERLTVEYVQTPEDWPLAGLSSREQEEMGEPYLHPSERLHWDSVWFHYA